MSYNRAPNTFLAGRGLKQTPSQTGSVPPGVVTVTVDSDIASISNLGLVQVGTGLSITPAGVLSVSGSGSIVNVYLTSVSYAMNDNDYFVGATNKGITLTMPLGILGKVFYVKNQSTGSITLTGTGGQTIDNSLSKNLGSETGVVCVFDGTRWNTI